MTKKSLSPLEKKSQVNELFCLKKIAKIYQGKLVLNIGVLNIGGNEQTSFKANNNIRVDSVPCFH